MKRFALILTILIFVLTAGSVAMAQEAAPQAVVDLAKSTLAKFGTDPVIVAAVKAQNAKGMSLDDIKAMDEKWKNTSGIADFMSALMESECGKHLRGIQNSSEMYAEIFVMDNQGANVAQTDKTSDYWQGDEAKWQESFKGGSGAVHISEVEFDESSQAYVVQVSVPVMDGDKAIGAITFGIDVDKME